MKTVKLSDKLSVSYVGKGKESGQLPALIYLALSDKDSLTTDPYNQPVEFLKNSPLRIFSFTLPSHENNLPPKQALSRWAEAIATSKDLFSPFFTQAKSAIDLLIKEGWILPEKLAIAGLSRGAFFACHLAARCQAISTILGFAPLIRLSATKEFLSLSNDPSVQALDLHTLIPNLYNKKVRFYIGNCDQRVKTEHAFSLINSLASYALKEGLRSSPIELIIGPSFGYQGHGTPRERFQSGVNYLKGELL